MSKETCPACIHGLGFKCRTCWPKMLVLALSFAAVAAVAAKPTCTVNVNRAPVDSLIKCLPGVGPAMAKRIDSARSVKPFSSCADLDAVKGFGEKKLSAVCPLAVF